MNKSTPILKTICAATILAMGLSAQANVSERYIVTYDSNSQGLKKGHQIKVEGKNWFAVELDEKGKSSLMAKAGFKNIEVDAKRFPMSIYNDTVGSPDATEVTPYGYFQSQADQLTLQAGQKVCVIDSGIAGKQGETGGRNEDFNWAQITGDNDPGGTNDWDSDGGPHGTHVAGTIGAVKANGFGVVGMAPGVPMHIIKVFNDAGWGYSSDLAQAADLCLAAGANIINMSLGGGGANSTEENAFINFTANAGANGGLVLAAAGNDGNSVRSFPAGYESVMMIGAVDADNVVADFSQFPPNTKTTRVKGKVVTDTNDGYGVEVSAGGVNTLSTVPSGVGKTTSLVADSVTYASSGMENFGSASGSAYFMGTAESTDANASGKVCIIERGVISFADKVLNCENSGGIGAVIFNNEPGMLYGTLGTPITSTIPAVGATQEDGAALSSATTASISVSASSYDYFSGTSMATPTTSGVAALVWSNNPNCTGTEVREALKATAQDQGATDRDDYYGYGIIKAAAANAYLANSSCGGAPANYPPTASFNFSCTDLVCSFNSTSSDSDGTIASTSWTFGDGNSAAGSTANNTYAATGSYTATVTVIDNEGASSSSSQTVSVSDGSEPPVGDITLSGTRSGNGRNITLDWNGATGTNVDVYVNGGFNNTTANDGSITYNVNKRNTYTFEVCEEGSTTACSNSVTL